MSKSIDESRTAAYPIEPHRRLQFCGNGIAAPHRRPPEPTSAAIAAVRWRCGLPGRSGGAAALRLGAKSQFARELAALFGVVRRDHGIVRRQAPALAILLRRHVVRRLEVALEHLQLLAVLETDDVVGHDR